MKIVTGDVEDLKRKTDANTSAITDVQLQTKENFEIVNVKLKQIQSALHRSCTKKIIELLLIMLLLVVLICIVYVFINLK